MRPLRLPATFVLWFIAPDDRAIGDRSKYTEYLRTGDEDLLALKEGVSPSYYFLHPLGDNAGDEIRSVFGQSEDGEVASEAQEIATEALTQSLVRTAFCGCTAHPMFRGQEKNKALIERMEWKVNEPAPVGVLEDIMGDKQLVTVAFNFLISRSVLSEDEKN